MISLIVAASDNNVIGKDNDLPWYLPDDLKHFRNTTRGHPVIMGRKNFESIEPRLNGPLPGRQNIVITRNRDWKYENVDVVHSLSDALKTADTSTGEIFIIGGGQIYREALESGIIDRMYITWVHTVIDGDVHFPEFDASLWKESSKQEHLIDDKHEFGFTIVTYDRL